MKLLLLIPIISLALYLVYVFKKSGMTISISATYKVIKGIERLWFSLTLWLIVLPIMIVAIEGIPSDIPQVLFFLAGSLICLVAASPKYWSNKHELTAHLIGSYGGIILGMIACLLHYFCLYTLIIITTYGLFTLMSKLCKLKNYIYWIEVGAVITVCLILFINNNY